MKQMRAALNAAMNYTKRAPAQLDLPLKKRRKTRRERFEAFVDRSGGPLACHPWTGSVMQANGYGQFYDKGTMRTAHRVAWELTSGVPVPAGALVLHSRVCTTPLCCNGRHLRLGNAAENLADSYAVGRKGGRKLNAVTARQIANLRIDGLKVRDLAERFGVGLATVRDVLKGRTWSHATGIPPGTKSSNRGRPPKLRAIERFAA